MFLEFGEARSHCSIQVTSLHTGEGFESIKLSVGNPFHITELIFSPTTC